MSIRPNISSLQFDIRKIADFAAKFPDCIRADIGEPDYHPPQDIYHILQKLCNNEDFAYAPTFGLDSLLVSLEKFEASKFRNFANGQFCVTTGAQAGLFSTFSALLNPGDEVIVHKAYYPPYKSICQILGANLISVDLCDEDKVAAKISDKTKIILLNNPCNPTGEVFEESVVKNLVKTAREKNLIIVNDDVYDRLVFEGKKISHASEFYPEGTIVVNSVSKTFCLTGARIGWILGEKKLVGEITKVHRNINSCPTSLMQKLVAEYLEKSGDFLEEMREEFQQRGHSMAQIFRDLGWECENPGGAMYLMPKIPELTESCNLELGFTTPDSNIGHATDVSRKHKNSEEFVYELIEKLGVSGVPGEMFGAENIDRVRFCFGALSREKIKIFGEKMKKR